MTRMFGFWKRLFDPDMGRLFTLLTCYKGKLVLTALLLLVAASASSATATLLGKLTDIGFYEEQRWIVFAGPLALLGVSVAAAAASVGSSVLLAQISQDVLVRLRTELFARMLRWPARAYQNLTTGQISAKFVNEAATALSGATQALMILIRDCVQCLALLVVLFWHNWQLTLVTLLLAPALVFILRAISRRMRVIVKSSQDNLADMISRVEEAYGAQRLIKIAAAYPQENAHFASINEKSRRLALSTIKMQNLATPLTQILTMVAVGFVVGVALWEAQAGWLTFGDFITFMTAMLLLRDPIQKLSGLNGTFAAIAVSARSIFACLDAEVEEDNGRTQLRGPITEITFEEVSLRYPQARTNALTDVSFTVRSGEQVALVGPSGAGKTSLANLAARFWSPTSGRILVNGRDVQEYTLQSLRAQIAIVSQEIVLFDDTLRANLTYGLGKVTEEAIQRAIKDAALQDFVASLPQGLDTRAGEEGRLLSGGQRQRIAIARAFLKNASFLIFDEATSALDAQAEAEIRASLTKLARGRAVLTIAHRFSTISTANWLVVLDHGCVQEMGTQEELLALPHGLYRHLRSLQTGGAS